MSFSTVFSKGSTKGRPWEGRKSGRMGVLGGMLVSVQDPCRPPGHTKGMLRKLSSEQSGKTNLSRMEK